MAGSHGQPRADDPKLLAQFRRSFAFDAVFDSSGGPQESAPRATQQDVFDNLGTYILDNALEGYNCSMLHMDRRELERMR